MFLIIRQDIYISGVASILMYMYVSLSSGRVLSRNLNLGKGGAVTDNVYVGGGIRRGSGPPARIELSVKKHFGT